ncbi:hypothetical protein TIFTF001_022336 [Ficus carica]|uniref:Protein FAR1-RELATED SEQUENCE n=1 Tax=Ficus carica TaxID=3494 RepID=A0AA88DCQ6_FICCA|nr:hypothetical protein TIFTF001_022336 [Ficus carica]
MKEWDNSIGNPSVVQSLASECDKDEISSTESDEDEIQSDLPANEKRHPEIGMEFSSEEEAYKFYKTYAEEVGFSVRKGKVTRLTDGTIRKRKFLCSRQGFKLKKISNKTTKYERKETRTGCNAYVQFTIEDGKWIISNFIHDHNHEFDKPRQQHVTGSFEDNIKHEFEAQWDLLLTQYNLRENSWLTTLHSLWEKWSHLFNKKIFSAGIELLFHSANINVTEILSLPDFVQQYIKEAKQRRLEELREDLCCSKMLPVRSRKGMEKHAEDIYTSTMFKKFQDELLDSLSLAIEEVTCSGNISTFKLTEEGQKKEDIVTFDCSSSTVTCSCGKFQTIGILCGHCIKVLNAKNIFHIPSQYILKRWTKSAKEGEGVDHIEHSEKDQTARKSQRQSSSYSRNVMHKTLQIINKSLGIEESRKMVEGSLDLALKRANEILKEKRMEQSVSSTGLEVEVNSEACCGIDSAVIIRNRKMTSNSSCVNREQGSKNKMKSSKRQGSTKTM